MDFLGGCGGVLWVLLVGVALFDLKDLASDIRRKECKTDNNGVHSGKKREARMLWAKVADNLLD
jgi:hypothetical protein